MANNLLKRMRDLRGRAELLNRTLVEDYRPFLNPNDKTTFFRLPSKPPSGPDDIGVSTTCTALMALAMSGAFQSFYGPSSTDELKKKILSGMQSLLATKWETGGLEPNNTFSCAIVLRSSGMLFKAGFIDDSELGELKRTCTDTPKTKPARKFRGKTLEEIAKALMTQVPEHLSVEKYPPTPSIAYWFFDAVSLLGFDIESDAAKKVAEWASDEFARQVSLISANHQAMMDPVAMAMAACLCRLLRRMAANQNQTGLREHISKGFPTDVELRSAIELFFQQQNSAGVWEKYFALFHYPEAGANHCWHFEVLEAILHEFPKTVRDDKLLKRIDHSITWLEDNRLSWQGGGPKFFGWNSGGELRSLRNGEPESWPTGVVHMFLTRLQTALAVEIQELVLQKYGDRVKRFGTPDHESWDKYLDCDLPGLNGRRHTVKGLLEIETLEPAEKAIKKFSDSLVAGESGQMGPEFQLSDRRSALLFGPPGTSKTSLAEAVAERLGWTFIELTPSDFLKGGLSGIYDSVNDVFDDLMDLFGTVILFDEMDALVQSREMGDAEAESQQLDVTQKFLTTSMLPKLLKLRKSGRSIFFMATNHQGRFDPAIKRSGRFDLLIRMGPPSFTQKLRGLLPNSKRKYWYRAKETPDDRKEVERLFKEYTTPAPATTSSKDALEYFTFGEMSELFDFIRRLDTSNENLKDGMEKIRKEGFQETVQERFRQEITLSDGGPAFQEFNGVDERAIRIQ